jgi:Polyketide cyclase / dehydrase and lipid transport
VRLRATALLAIGLLAPAFVSAATIVRTEATHDDGRYRVSFEVVLDAERSRIWRIMTDYEHLTRVSKVIVESRLLKSASADRPRVAVTMHACVLIFCKTIKKVVDIQVWPQTEIKVTGDPALSDFSYSVERWRVVAEGAKTRLFYDAEMEPDFFIPPLIGPWLVKSFMQREIKATAIQVEALAGHE